MPNATDLEEFLALRLRSDPAHYRRVLQSLPLEVEGLRRWWLSWRDHSEATQANYLSVARSYLRYLSSLGDEGAAGGLRWLEANARVRLRPRPPQSRRKPLSPEEFDRFLGAFSNERERLAVEVLYRTGIRPATLLALSSGSLVRDPDGAWLVFETKGGRQLSLPCPESLYARLEGLEGRWFPWTLRGLHGKIQRASIQTVGRRLSARDFRRGFITRVYAKTHDLLLASKLAGHANIRTTQIYVQEDRERMRAVMEAL